MSNSDNINNLGLLIRDGDHLAFMKLYEKYVDGLFNFIRKFIADENVVEDLIHDSFYNLWRYRRNIKEGHPIQNYLYRIARNEVYKELTKQIQRKTTLSTYAENKKGMFEGSAYQTVLEDELGEIYNMAINKLPPQRKRIFIMCREEGLSHKEIAEHLNISPNTVKEHMSLAMRTIKDYITKEHDVIFTVSLLCSLPFSLLNSII
ncbi:RNA polymerase sigma-70 factor [Sphingobacterium sp. UT-1RO-CII-1]|uniref:RNA polymerase sigma-70 factor n=1 Tax=Sphingobacterium sp. UT-1RO-CII-1 TaxID=2995225 RepID=UPI00227D367C|nr:RNA polymerase sigma-70 factor [Sphingobacterium sp. UT-1RO-CII-1]MCY4778794.1 RNA polymerase sigma-70 factor [Sphingobacterium sp. UT-1RO-CII-1]